MTAEMTTRKPDARHLLISLLKDKTVRGAAAAGLLQVDEQQAGAEDAPRR